MKRVKKVKLCPICGNEINYFVCNDKRSYCQYCRNDIKYDDMVWIKVYEDRKK